MYFKFVQLNIYHLDGSLILSFIDNLSCQSWAFHDLNWIELLLWIATGIVSKQFILLLLISNCQLHKCSITENENTLKRIRDMVHFPSFPVLC